MSTRRGILSLLVLPLACAGCVRGQLGEPPETAPAPAPERPAVVEKGTPQPAPVEHTFRLCAVAPGQTTGLRTLEAVVIEGRADTLAVLGGERVPLTDAVGAAHVATRAPWFVERRSLEISAAGRVQRFGIYDVAREIEAGQLAYLGTVDSLPVYVAAEDVAPVKAELVRRLAIDHNLTKILAESPAIRARLRAVDVLYVPLHATGCIFQPLLRAGVR